MEALGFKIWIFAPKSWLFGGIRVRIWIFAPKTLVSHQSFVKIMLQSWNCQSAVCLHFQLFVYIFVSCLFTFLSADCLLFLFVYNLNFRAKNLGFPSVFCQNNASKFVYIFSCLFTFSAVCLFTFSSADCLLLSAVCLQFQFSSQNHVFSISPLSK